VPATNAEPPPGASAPVGESPVASGPAGGGVVPLESAPAGSGRRSAAVSEVGAGDAVHRGAAAQDVASGVPGGGVVPSESVPLGADRMSGAEAAGSAHGSASARDLVRDVARTGEAPSESATAEGGRAAVSEAGSGDTARGVAVAPDSVPTDSGESPAGSDRAGAAALVARTGEPAHAGVASDLVPDVAESRDPAPAPAELQRTGVVASGARSDVPTHSEARDGLPAAAHGEAERGVATAPDAALTEAVPGTRAPGSPPAHGAEAGGSASDDGAPEDPVPGPERLRGALEDVDRAWYLTFGEPTPPPAPVVGDCRIVIDVARDGRRFAGPRAAAVLRSIAGRLHLQLPAGARVGTEPHDGLVIEIPSTGYGSAARWMNRTLPGLLDGLTFDDDFARLHLRSVVHGADGPVGAQLLVRLDQQPLESPSDRSSSPERPAGRATEIGDPQAVAQVGPPEPAVSTCGCPTEAAFPAEQARSEPGGLPVPGHALPAAGDGALINGRDPVPAGSEGAAAAGNGEPVAGEGEWAVSNGAVLARGALSATYGGPVLGEGNGSPAVGAGGLTVGRDPSAGHGAPVVGRDGHAAAVAGRPGAGPEPSAPDGATGPSGRHAATDRTPFRPSPSSHNPSHAGRRHRPDPATPARPQQMPDTEGLGLADLLAGALAAYRGI
jgi:hypothetical protein